MISFLLAGPLLFAVSVGRSDPDRTAVAAAESSRTLPVRFRTEPVKARKPTNPLISPLGVLLVEIAYELAKEHGPELLKELNGWIRPSLQPDANTGEKPYGRLRADREKVGEWEVFRVFVHEDKSISFAAHTGFLSAEAGGGLAIANRKTIGDSEKWILIDLRQDMQFGLRSKSGHYLCVNDDPKKVTVDRKGLGEWETFTLVHDEAKKTCSIRCWNGKYLSAQP